MIKTRFFLGDTDPEFSQVERIRQAAFANGGEVKNGEVWPEVLRDAFDEYAVQVLAYVDDVPVGCGRLFHDGADATIGRICVLPEYRGRGIGDLVTRVLLYKASTTATERLVISARSYIAHMYEKFGFTYDGGEYMEDGLPHRRMVLDMDKLTFPHKCGH